VETGFFRCDAFGSPLRVRQVQAGVAAARCAAAPASQHHGNSNFGGYFRIDESRYAVKSGISSSGSTDEHVRSRTSKNALAFAAISVMFMICSKQGEPRVPHEPCETPSAGVDPAQLRQLLGAPPVLSTENVRSYHDTMGRLLECLAPRDFMEQIE
jgi:hypothetical protein